ncbi:MAG: sigma-54 dependent transcriptional regulator [Moraxellaceae bacterium]|nr:sigma-54 dependent transcriptional regulator [Moraxellaceae bacterium]MDZ4298003.1 sigma-54 dependent transcriptional regulator [Moraxellaceae bacterium]MDZ4387470.1 sigma-54 dependent transcriptional regulator [Moraxellaceae bacterium]
MSQILVVDDEIVIRNSLKKLLERHQHEVETAGSVDEVVSRFAPDSFDLIISDLRLPGEVGTALINRVGNTPILIMTSFASIRSAVDAVKAGAADYIAKPFDHDDMILTVDRILRERRLQRQNAALRADIHKVQPGRSGIIGSCEAMQKLHKRLERVAPLNTTVLILGESGTGKELVARALHELSPRVDAPLISVNCAAIPESLIESELFGYEKGAFTGAQGQRKGLVEAADGGTLFLDEIGELPMEAQARLLRLLQEKEIRRLGSTQARRVDVRVIAATHRNLKQLIKDSLFREDLYFRLNVMEIELPPLRDRGMDILELAQALLKRTIERIGSDSLTFSNCALEAISQYAWPGNIRELENAIERAVILCEDDRITPELLAIETTRKVAPDASKTPSPEASGDLSLEDYFQQFVLDNQEHMSETVLASKLGISRKTLWERRNKLGIPRRRGGTEDGG